MRHAPVDDALAFRVRLLAWLAIALLGVFAARLYLLQVVSWEHYRGEALSNSVKERALDAPRGLVLDRRGRLLVGNRRSWDLVLERELCPDPEAALALVQELTGAPTALLRERLARDDEGARGKVTLARDLLFSQVAWFEARREDVLGLSIASKAVRDYPEGELAAHLVGYVGEVSALELERTAFGAYHRPRDLVGKRGIERQHDRLLTGRRGMRRSVVDHLGRETSSEIIEAPVRGADLFLSLDLEVQRAAERALAGRPGACVVLDARDGGVIALASSPTYEPAAFVGGVSSVRWSQYRDDPDVPLRSRAIAGTYPPGSVWKPLVAAAALDEGVRSPGSEATCGGQVRVHGQTRRCWKRGGHGTLDLAGALVNSCNVYFYLTARDVGLDAIERRAAAVGLGRRTGIDLPEEVPGILPGDGWKRREIGEPWYPGDTVNLGIGQGFLSVTPLQVGLLAVAIANGGAAYRPRVLSHAADPVTGARVHELRPEVQGRLEISPATLRFLHAAMVRTVESGTGRRARLEGISVAGKTGTAQPSSGDAPEGVPRAERARRYQEHAWFMGFAPAEAPEVAFAIVLEHAGKHGGEVAAPIAREVLAAWFADRLELTGQ